MRSEDERTASMLIYVNQIERILHKERGQWEQLVSEVRPSEPSELSHSKLDLTRSNEPGE